MVESAIFESAGQRTEHFVPGAYSRSYNVSSPSGVSAGNHVILGQSKGGEPFKLLEFGTVAEARDALVGGNLLDAVGYAFNASNSFPPQKVFAMRVNAGTQAYVKLTVGSTELLKVSSWDWGTHANKLKMLVSNGAMPNSKKLTFVYKDDSVVVDNIVREQFSIVYGGSGDNAGAVISNNSLKLSATTGEETVDNYEFGFESYDTLDSLVQAINDTGVYIATILASDNTLPTSELDTAVETLTDTPKVFYSNYQAFIDALKTVPYVGGVEELQNTVRQTPENSTTYLYFQGGTSGEYSISQWTKALETLESEDVHIISTPSTDEKVHTLIANHCKSMSTTGNRKGKTCFLGGAIGISDDDAIARARALNSKLVSFVCDSGLAANPFTGEKEKIPGSVVGCMLAAMESGMAVNEPLTNKTLNILEFDKKRTIPNMEKLIKGGILVCNQSPTDASQFVVIRALTTFQGSGDLISCERSMVREDLYMNRDLRNRYSLAIGRPTEGSTDSIIQTLKDAARAWATAGLIVPNGSDNVWNIKVSVNGDKTYVYFSRYLTAPRNFVFITATNHVYETSVEL